LNPGHMHAQDAKGHTKEEDRSFSRGLQESTLVDIPGLVGPDCIGSMEYTAQTGRYVVAQRMVPKGTVVHTAECFSLTVMSGHQEFTCAGCLKQAEGYSPLRLSCDKCEQAYFCSPECAEMHDKEQCRLQRAVHKKNELDGVGAAQVLLTCATQLKQLRVDDALVNDLTTAGASDAAIESRDRWDSLLVVVRSVMKKMAKAAEDGIEAPGSAALKTLWLQLEANSYGWWSKDRQCTAVGLFPSASYFNHSCAANLGRRQVVAFPPRFEYVALRDIEEGEELTVFYTRPDVLGETRRKTLKSSYAFDCECWRCKFEMDLDPISEERRGELQEMEEQFMRDTVCQESEECSGVLIPVEGGEGRCCSNCGNVSG